MTSGELVMISFGGRVSWDDSTALVAFAKACEMLGSWSSYRKTLVGTVAQLELSLANSSMTSFFQGRQSCFLTCGAPSNTTTFCRSDMITLCWPD
jgi:hypothetical protein